MNRAQRRQKERRLRSLKLVPCDFKLTAAAGMGTILEVFDQTPLAKEFQNCLPERVSHRSVGSYRLALMVLASHLHGMQALSDIVELNEDPALEALFEDELAATRTIGDFLRDFEEEHLEQLNRFLNKMSHSIMNQFDEVLDEAHQPKTRVIDVDSTYHEQYGDKIEGVDWNYKWQWCLESQVAFNQMGLCHGLQLRPGNTKSGTDAESLIEQCFKDKRSQKTRRLEGKDFFRADSAYCNQSIIKKLMGLGVQFTLTANDATTQWKSHLEEEGLAWEKWKHSQRDKDRAEAKNRKLPDIEVARYFWKPSWGKGQVVLPMIIKRTWKTLSEVDSRGQGSLFHQDSIKNEGQWQYYAVVTNFDLNQWSVQEIFEHHAKRGHAENFIKEEKYNFKLRKFPCQKMSANHTWALFGQVAHNLIRWMAIIQRPDKPHFAKKLRRRLIFFPGKVVKHARQIMLKISHKAYEEVTRLRQRWQSTLKESAHAFV